MEYNPFSLINKTILVTGASSGIGRSVAVECSKLGATVIITARNHKRLNETLNLLEYPDKHFMFLADLSNRSDITLLSEKLPMPLDGIVQCAGIAIPKPFQFISENDLQSIMDINFNASVYLTQQLLKKKMIAKSSSIVFVSSISGIKVSSIGGSIYSASKGAINGLQKGLAIELAAKNIRVNSVNPGMIETDIYKDEVISKEQFEIDKLKYPLKRYGKPEEVAYAVVYLLSDASAWVTGSNLLIDGGFTLL